MIQLSSPSVYAEAICNFVKRISPALHKHTDKSLVDAISSIILGTKDYRYGPLPSVESQVLIRNVIRHSLSLNIPIPILVPFGGRKLNATDNIDVAELAAIKQLLFIQHQVAEIYSPSIHFVIRVEDINAMYLYGMEYHDDIMRYSDTFEQLVNIFAYDQGIQVFRESYSATSSVYFETADSYVNAFISVLTDLETNQTPTKMSWLINHGWKGNFPKEQRDYYLNRYRILYNYTDEEAIKALAKYFAGSKARYDLGLKGNLLFDFPNESYIQLNFAHPVPGAPEGIFDTTVYWRTIPAFEGRTHIAAWRAKGYLLINEGEQETKIKIASYHDLPEGLTETTLIITDGTNRVELNVPYCIQ